MTIKYYLKPIAEFIEDNKEYSIELENDTYTLYTEIEDYFQPLKEIQYDSLDGEDVVEFFKEWLY